MPPPPAAPPPPLMDLGNQLLAQGPAQMTVSVMPTQRGTTLTALTIRTPSTTVTVFLTKRDAEAWAAQLADIASQCSDGGLLIAKGAIPKQGTAPR